MITFRDLDLAGALVLVTLYKIVETREVDRPINEMFQLSPSDEVTQIAIDLFPAYCNIILDAARKDENKK